MWWTLWMLACGAPQNELVAPDAPSEWYQISLGEETLGVEERRVLPQDQGRIVWRQRELALRIDGQIQRREHTLWARLGGEGEVLEWRIRDEAGARSGRAGAEPVWLLELAMAERQLAGEVLTLDASGGLRRVEVEQGRWTIDGIDWEILEDGVRSGPLYTRRVSEPPALSGVDPAEILWRPAQIPDALRVGKTAAKVRFAAFDVEGQRQEVRAPFSLEIPAGLRAQLQGWTDKARRGGGDCKAQAAAWVARALGEGHEARVVHGLAWLDGPQGPGLVPHAWAEVSLEGGWLAVDPALDQLPADATHLSLSPAQLLQAEVILREVR